MDSIVGGNRVNFVLWIMNMQHCSAYAKGVACPEDPKSKLYTNKKYEAK